MRGRALKMLVACAALLAAAYVYGELRNPENETLDDAARAGADGRFVALTDGTTHYDVAGPDSGRVAVLVHGFSVPYYIWDSTSVALSGAGYRVVRYDLYGRGLSDRPDVDYDGALYDRQLGGLLDSLGIGEPVDLVGLSFGGFVTAHFAGRHPDRVRTLTLVDPVASRSDVPWTLRLPVLGSWLWQVRVVPGMADGQLTDFLHPENHPTWVDQYRPQMKYRGFGRALLSTMRMAAGVDFGDLYRTVSETGVPVLLIWGRQDRTVPLERSEVVRSSIPSVQFVPVDSAGHLPHIEQARFVNETLRAFLEAHPGPREVGGEPAPVPARASAAPGSGQ